MHRFLFVLFSFISLVFFQSCDKKNVANTQVTWMSEDPMTIPFWVRQQKFEKGNLVRNGSFENGKNIVVDSSGVTFRIDGWEKTGQHVEWVNMDDTNSYSADEAYDSIRAIKIIRTTPDETDETGEGIISDYIKVIPGNYLFTFYVRLENIRSALERAGLPLYDAVNVRLFFYDKNKIQISSKKYDPFYQVNVDYSFKSLSFSGFWDIEKMPWSWTIGKSVNSLCDGDIPDEARYVKIFFGLKGTGTMWVDLVDFRYSKLNFNSLELMQNLIDTTLLKQETLVPLPKSVSKIESVAYYKKDENPLRLPVIVIPSDASAETKEAALLLKERMENLLYSIDSLHQMKKVEIKTHISEDIIKSSRMIFSIGKNHLYRRFREILPVNSISNIPQAYFIYTPGDLSNIIFLCGNQSEGDYYAAATAIQLFDNKNYIFHNSHIVDYPDISERFVRYEGESDPETIRRFEKYKINGLYYSLTKDHSSFKDTPHDRLMKREILYFNRSDGFIPVKGVDGSVNIPAVSLSRDMLSKVNPGALLQSEKIKGIFLPPLPDNESMNRNLGDVKADLNTLKDSRYFWFGSSHFSWNTDNTDLFRIISVTGTEPVLWDNSMELYNLLSENNENPVKKDLFNLFRPFMNVQVKYLLNSLDDSRIFVNFNTKSELDEITMAVISDFLWNVKTFEPEESLWRTLHLRYGKECAGEMVYLNNDYAALLKINALLKNPMHYQRYFRKGENLKVILDTRIKTIGTLIGEKHPLVLELKKKTDDLKREFDRLEVKPSEGV